LEQSVLLNRYGWANDKITNQNRFVGFQIRTRSLTGLQTLINEIGLQFSGAESFDLSFVSFIKGGTIERNPNHNNRNGNWNWIKSDLELSV
jgi:hypothetical protein